MPHLAQCSRAVLASQGESSSLEPLHLHSIVSVVQENQPLPTSAAFFIRHHASESQPCQWQEPLSCDLELGKFGNGGSSDPPHKMHTSIGHSRMVPCRNSPSNCCGVLPFRSGVVVSAPCSTSHCKHLKRAVGHKKCLKRMRQTCQT